MIGEIEQNQTLLLKNVLCIRRKLDQQTAINISNEIDGILAQNKTKKNGSVITITHDITVENGQQIIDLEMMTPLDKEITAPNGFTFLSEFILENAFKLRIEGNPQQMQNAVRILAEHIKNKNLKPITPLYVVTVQEAKMQFDIENMVTDIYIGVEVL